jgi:hypothetical protein
MEGLSNTTLDYLAEQAVYYLTDKRTCDDPLLFERLVAIKEHFIDNKDKMPTGSNSWLLRCVAAFHAEWSKSLAAKELKSVCQRVCILPI